MDKKCILLVGLPRSGQHAVLNWICDQFEQNIYPIKMRGIFQKNVVRNFGRIDREIEEASQICVLHLEGQSLRSTANCIKWCDEVFKNTTTVLLLRDPYNWLASLVKYKRVRQKNYNIKDYILRWKKYADEYLGTTNYLGDKILINYNTWFFDIEERKLISSKIDGEFSDKSMDTFANVIQAFDGKYRPASKLKVFDRWKYLRDRTGDCFALNNIDASGYCKLIFGETEGYKHFKGLK